MMTGSIFDALLTSLCGCRREKHAITRFYRHMRDKAGISDVHEVLLNLITAVIVENAFQIVHEDEETIAQEKGKQMEQEMEEFAELFRELTKGTGQLRFEEFKDAAETNPDVIQKLTVLEIEMNELEELWELLDDGDGLVTSEEFSDGLRKVRGYVFSNSELERILF